MTWNKGIWKTQFQIHEKYLWDSLKKSDQSFNWLLLWTPIAKTNYISEGISNEGIFLLKCSYLLLKRTVFWTTLVFWILECIVEYVLYNFDTMHLRVFVRFCFIFLEDQIFCQYWQLALLAHLNPVFIDRVQLSKFLWIRFSSLKPLQETVYFLPLMPQGVTGSHLIDLGMMKGWADLWVTQWFWIWYLWIGNLVP